MKVRIAKTTTESFVAELTPAQIEALADQGDASEFFHLINPGYPAKFKITFEQNVNSEVDASAHYYFDGTEEDCIATPEGFMAR